MTPSSEIEEPWEGVAVGKVTPIKGRQATDAGKRAEVGICSTRNRFSIVPRSISRRISRPNPSRILDAEVREVVVLPHEVRGHGQRVGEVHGYGFSGGIRTSRS